MGISQSLCRRWEKDGGAVQSNYDRQACKARALFLTYDQGRMIERHALEHDEDYLYLMFIGDRFRIARKSGEVEICGQEAGAYHSCKDFPVLMSLFDALCYPQGTPKLSGEWRPLYNLQVTMSSPSADLFNQKYADLFSGHAGRLWEACQSLGGVKEQLLAGADVCCRFALFPFFPAQFRFWDADDEFPAKIQILWDRNSLQFLHFETLYYVMGHLMKKLEAVFLTTQEKGQRI